MPSPVQKRKDRIIKIYNELTGKHNVDTIKIYEKTLELYPFITETKAREYAAAVARMRKTKKNGE